MTDTTPIDDAHANMQASPDNDAARLRFYDRLAESELLVLLQAEVQGDQATPRLFETSGGAYVLAFDREERLTAFTGAPAPYLAVSGRALAGMLAGQDVGLGLNLDVAPSEILIPAGALDWLIDTLSNAPEEVEGRISELLPPAGLPENLLLALDAKLAAAAGLATSAYLAATRDDHGGAGHLLAFVDAQSGAEQALANAVGEALTFSGVEAGALDIGFFAASDPMSAKLAQHGLRFDLPEAPKAHSFQPSPPGTDPDKPPKLR